MAGDLTMIALRNVVDRDGQLLLAMGGVYNLPWPLCGELEELKISNQEWAGIDVSYLAVSPSTFLINTSAIHELGSPDTFRLVPQIFSQAQFIEDDLKRRAIWETLLANLEQFRNSFE